MRVLAGDIGGTHTRLGLFESVGGALNLIEEETVPSRDHPTLEEILTVFLERAGGACERAGLAVAGPVEGRVARATNLPWVVDAGAVERRLGGTRVVLLNDLEAVAYGISELRSEDFLVLNEGKAGASGNAAVIAAGTGLGEAGLFWDGTRHRPFPSEGGHTDFAPADAQQRALLENLAARFGHVSWERIVSGPGLVHLFRFLLETAGAGEPPWLAEAHREGDPAAAISAAGLADATSLAARALDLFATLYGSEAGNLALKLLSGGGVYVGGGIAPKIAAKLKEPPFMRGFLAKGRLRPVLEAMPVKVILQDRAGLLGAARCAVLESGGRSGDRSGVSA